MTGHTNWRHLAELSFAGEVDARVSV